MVQLHAQDVIREALPPLLVSQHHTTSSALTNKTFIGPLREWTTFLRDVQSFHKSQRWSRKIVGHELVSRDVHRERVYVGDEHGLQGRFQQSVGQVVGSALEAQSTQIVFGDFKAAGVHYNLVPDFALISTDPSDTHKLKAIGELKVPWVPVHDFESYEGHEADMRKLLAQPIGYMLGLRIMYGWMTNYDQTIFLRQTFVGNSWGIEYSPTIKWTTPYIPMEQTHRALGLLQ